MEMLKRICRLCFKTCENFQVIEEDTLNIFNILHLKINLAVSEEPVMCTNCANTLKNSVDFKAMCTHNYADSFIHKEENVKLDLNKVYLSKKEHGLGIPEDETVCGFCMGLVKKCTAISLDYQNSNVMLEKCLPELDFRVINAPIICRPCQESLHNWFHFMNDCSIAEEEIQKYCEAEGVNSESVIHIIKERKIFHEDQGNGDGEVKNNDVSLMEVEEQKLNTAQQFLSNTLICKQESNEDTGGTVYLEKDIKIERKNDDFEELVEQKLININESLMVDQKLNNVQQFTSELEDDKCLIIEKIEIKTEQNEFDSLHGEDSSSQPTDGIQCKKDVEAKYKIGIPRHTMSRKNSKVMMYQCESCSFQSTRKSRLNIHMLTHKDPSEIELCQCTVCPFKARHKVALQRHMLIHKDPSEVTMYQCASCTYQAKRKQSVDRHMLIHKDPSEVKMYQCASCPFNTKYQQSLREHMLSHDLSETTAYQCESCSFKTATKARLYKHMLIHKDPSEITMYQCDSCSFQTRYKHYMARHVLSHQDPSETTMYQCEYCTYKAKHKDHLFSHMLTHKDPSEMDMYHCDSCSFHTRRKRNLNRHMLTHKDPLEIIMYQCDSCSYGTKYKHHLTRHVLTHQDPSKL